MAKARKDNKGRALQKGECQRKSDLRYIYTYTDSFGKRRYIYAVTLMELRAKKKEILRDQLDGICSIKTGCADINSFFDRYMMTKTELKPTTAATYNYAYNYHVRPGFGKRSIKDIRYSDVILFYHSLLREKHLKINTLNTINSLLLPTFQMAVNDDILRKNPVRGAMAELKKKKGKDDKPKRPLTKEQQKVLLDFIESNPCYNFLYTMVVVFLGTGMRVGELTGLCWQDVDFDKRLISVNHNVSYYKQAAGKCRFYILKPKTDSGIRMIPMADSVYEVLKRKYEVAKRNRFRSIEIDGMSGFIFCNKKGGIYYAQYIDRYFVGITSLYNEQETKKAATENRKPVLLPHITCHLLRHTFCTRLCEQDVNIKVIQAVMGHSDVQTTLNIYAKVSEEKKQQHINNITLGF